MSDAAVVFDLDGTLIDSLDDIADAANRALAGAGFPTHPAADYRHFVGEGVAVLIRRILPAECRDEATLERVAAAYLDAYAAGWHVKTRPYDGIPELLDALVARGVPLAVLSNKPQDFTELCVRQFCAAWPFRPIVGQRDGVPRKPDPASALAIARELGLDPAACWFVGDTRTDMETASRAGMRPIGVSWGFRDVAELTASGAERVIHHPRELLDLLDAGRTEGRP